MSPSVLLGATLSTLLFAACGTPSVTHRVDSEAEARVTAANLERVFNRDGEFWVGPALAAEGTSRIAAMVTVSAPQAVLPLLEGRGRDHEVASRWVDLRELWREDELAVIAADLDGEWPLVEVRLRQSDVTLVRELVWAAVRPAELDSDPDEARREILAAPPAPHALLENIAAWGVEPRAAWQAIAPRCSTSDPDKTMLAVHHTATSPGEAGNFAAKLRQIQAYHMDGQGWCDIGYHFLITLDGTVWEGREMSELGAHISSANSHNLGLSFVGCFHPTSDCAGMEPLVPPEVMIDEAGRILGLLAHLHQFAIDGTTVKGHRDFPGAATACPGDNLHARLVDLRADAVALLAERGGDCPCDLITGCERKCPCDPECRGKKGGCAASTSSWTALALGARLAWFRRRGRSFSGGNLAGFAS